MKPGGRHNASSAPTGNRDICPRRPGRPRPGRRAQLAKVFEWRSGKPCRAALRPGRVGAPGPYVGMGGRPDLTCAGPPRQSTGNRDPDWKSPSRRMVWSWNLVEGEMLRGPLPVQTALNRAGQVAAALEAAHSKGIIHRDLKPANIRVTPEGTVKVLDFGLAKAIWGPERNLELSKPDAGTGVGSVAGQVVGTPGYMSPEQARGREVDKRTDIWAFGCLLYELLTGKRAFPGETQQDTIAAVLEREPDWRALPAKTPAPLRELLQRSLQKDAGRRLDNIAEARRTIEQAQRGSNRWRVAAIAAAAMAMLAGAADPVGAWSCRPARTLAVGYAHDAARSREPAGAFSGWADARVYSQSLHFLCGWPGLR